MIKVGILGATGYAGQQLVWFLNQHDDVDIKFLATHSNDGVPFSDVYPHYESFINHICISFKKAEEQLKEIDCLFMALPHGLSFDIASKAIELGVKVIDIGSDYRLLDDEKYQEWYGLPHDAKDLLGYSVYGIPELSKDKIEKALLVANPGCYPTATTLALAPLIKGSMIDLNSIIVDAKSGVTGAGRSAKISSLFTEVNESFKAYGVTNHRHTPEIEQTIEKLSGVPVTIQFTPHLLPINRGILSTCYTNSAVETNQEELLAYFKEFYQDKPFVRVIDGLPETRHVRGTNLCELTVRYDKRTKRIIVIAVIDNLIKGASGQAIQNMNIMFGLEESKGIDIIPLAP